jgi:hypothetical protein
MDGPGGKRAIRAGKRGCADITGISFGIRVEIEIKVPGKKPTHFQEMFGEEINSRGGIWFYASSAQEAVKKLTDELEKRRKNKCLNG